MIDLQKDLGRGRGKSKEQSIPFNMIASQEMIEQRCRADGTAYNFGAIGPIPLAMIDPRNILTIGGCRSGKSVQIACDLMNFKGSVVVIGPKGEIASIVARKLAETQNKAVYVVDPFGTTAPWVKPYLSGFNIMVGLTLDNPFIIEDAGTIADALIMDHPGSDPFWSTSGKTFLGAIILHVATYRSYEGKRNLVTVHKLVTLGIPDIDPDDSMAGLVFEMKQGAGILRKKGFEDIADSLEGGAHDFFDREPKEQGSVLSTVKTALIFLSYPSIRKCLSRDDFRPEDLKRKNMFIVLSLPVGRLGTCARLFRLFLNMTLEAIERNPKKPDIPIRIVLDEFACMGYSQQIENAIGQLAGFGVQLHIVVQDLNQLKAIYKDRWETFIANSGVIQVMGITDPFTCEYFSRMLGTTPVKVRRQSTSSKEGLGGESYSVEMHPLLTPQEITRFFSFRDPLKRQLIISPGLDPIICQRMEYWDKSSPVYGLLKGKWDDFEKWINPNG